MSSSAPGDLNHPQLIHDQLTLDQALVTMRAHSDIARRA
jgi:hypothetical protein